MSGHPLTRTAGSALPRRLAVAVLVDASGTGMYLAGAALFFTEGLGLTALQVGVGLSAAGALSLVTTYPLGLLGDRVGAGRLLPAVAVVRAVGFGCYALVNSFPAFLAVALLLGTVDRAMAPLTQALVTVLVRPDRRIGALATMRVLRNLGFAAGGALSAVLLGLGGRAALDSVVLGNALSFLVVAALLRTSSAGTDARTDAVTHEPTATGSGRPPAALRDGRYVVLTLLNGVLLLHLPMLTLLLPLWLRQATGASRSLVPVLFTVNTVLVALLQVRTARAATTSRRAGAMLAVAAGAFAASALVLASSDGAGPTAATVLLVAAVLLLTAGELLSSAGGWWLSVELAPERARSSYLSLFSLGMAGQAVLGPLLLTGVVLRHHAGGWVGLALVFAAAGVVAPVVARSGAGRVAAAGQSG